MPRCWALATRSPTPHWLPTETGGLYEEDRHRLEEAVARSTVSSSVGNPPDPEPEALRDSDPRDHEESESPIHFL